MEMNNKSSRRTQTTENPVNNAVVLRNNSGLSNWRPSSFVSIANDIIRRGNPVLDSIPSVKSRKHASKPPESAVAVSPFNGQLKRNGTGRNTILNIVLVEAKGLPDATGDGLSHGINCRFRLGNQTYKSKSVTTTRHPQWRERFKLNGSSDQLLRISLWDKGKQKNFMGGCVLDLSTREIERTHDLWQELDDGYGSIHLSVTICTIRNLDLTTPCVPNIEDLRSKYAFYKISTDLEVVGQLHVKVIGARGLCGKPNAYCTLELDNEKIQTPKVSSTSEPTWNKNYVFNIFDVTSVLEVKVHDSSINSLLNDFLGRVSIPLLRITDGETRWYALKDNSKRRSAKGNCPRVRLEISIIWNPVTASLKLFRPKQVKYIAKQPKFDIPLVYKNCAFIRDTFEFLYRINESFKRLFEWEDPEIAYTALLVWLFFWYFFELWMGPLLILALFPVCYIFDQKQNWDFRRPYTEEPEVENNEDVQNGETMTHKIKGLPEMTLTITNGIEYMVSAAERLYNLAAFKVPFLSYLTIALLIGGSVVLYCIPFKYLMMSFALYKFSRKRIYPDRVLNNDLLDFISRIPDHKILKDWKELSVPEPHQQRNFTCPPTPPSTPTTPTSLTPALTPPTPKTTRSMPPTPKPPRSTPPTPKNTRSATPPPTIPL